MAMILARARKVWQHKLLAGLTVVVSVVAAGTLDRLVTVSLLHTPPKMSLKHGFTAGSVYFGFAPYVTAALMKLARLTAMGWLTGRLHRPQTCRWSPR
jgi:hypothetical protein